MATDQNQLPIAPPDTMKRLKEIIAGGPDESAWDDAWKGGVTPWDAKAVQPPLRTLIDSARFPLPKEGRALVPGCGSGYDAIFIAESLGLHTVAVDISPTALDAGRTLLASLEDPALASKLTFLEADFFALALPEDKKFDLVYDYTFFVAIPPARRLEWGRQISALTKPGAYLITLMFPLDQDPGEQGPPHYLQPEHYDAPLKGWTKLVEEVPPVSLPTHIDRERIAVWEKLA